MCGPLLTLTCFYFYISYHHVMFNVHTWYHKYPTVGKYQKPNYLFLLPNPIGHALFLLSTISSPTFYSFYLFTIGSFLITITILLLFLNQLYYKSDSCNKTKKKKKDFLSLTTKNTLPNTDFTILAFTKKKKINKTRVVSKILSIFFSCHFAAPYFPKLMHTYILCLAFVSCVNTTTKMLFDQLTHCRTFSNHSSFPVV